MSKNTYGTRSSFVDSEGARAEQRLMSQRYTRISAARLYMLGAGRATFMYVVMTSLLNQEMKRTVDAFAWRLSLRVRRLRHAGHIARKMASARCTYCNFFFRCSKSEGLTLARWIWTGRTSYVLRDKPLKKKPSWGGGPSRLHRP